MAAIPFIGHLSEGFIIFRGTAHNIHIILQLSEYRLYIVTPLIAVLEDNREDTTDVTRDVTRDVTTEVTTELNTEDTREVVLIVTDEAVEEVIDSV